MFAGHTIAEANKSYHAWQEEVADGQAHLTGLTIAVEKLLVDNEASAEW